MKDLVHDERAQNTAVGALADHLALGTGRSGGRKAPMVRQQVLLLGPGLGKRDDRPEGRGQEVDDEVGVGGRRLGGRELDRDGVRGRRRLDPGVGEFQEVLVGLGDLLDDVGAAGAELGGIENVDEDDVDLHRLTSVSDFVRLKPLC